MAPAEVAVPQTDSAFENFSEAVRVCLYTAASLPQLLWTTDLGFVRLVATVRDHRLACTLQEWKQKVQESKFSRAEPVLSVEYVLTRVVFQSVQLVYSP